MHIEPFEERYRRALNDPQLRANLVSYQRRWVTTRPDALEGTDFVAVRSLLAERKADVVSRLPDYVQQFASNARGHGAKVIFAATGEEVAAYIISLASERGVDRVVKSKSMVSEEIFLNSALGAAGIEAIETDLGEWIVQLAGERPSHIIGPALHMNRRQTARILSAATGRALGEEDIGEQVAAAREHIRADFLSAKIGISGANVLVAETGTVGIVTNEGNAELVTSIPPVHVVVVGREKVVPALEDAATVLQLLPPSATGQRATSYVTWITGPSAPGAELHIIVLDNGRERMRADPQFSDALRCIKCGACSTVCPSFGVVGGHVFGYVYSGAIGLVNTPFHHGLEEDAGPLSLCVSCNACQTVCPVDIPLPRQILDHRARLVEATGLPLQERLILEIWSRPRVFRSLARIGAVLQRPLQREGHISVPFSPGRTARRAPPALAPRPFRDTLPRLTPPLPGALGATLSGVRVAFFIQCLTDWLCPEIAGAVVDVLRSLGATVVVPHAQHCCGLPALDGGDRARARSMARHTIAALESAGADYVVTGGTSCAIAIMSDYERLFDGDAKWERRGRELARRTLDFTSFMDRVVKLPAGALGPVGRGGMPERQTAYHHFCQAHNVLGNRDEPLRLLGEVCGLELAPLPEANWCCGFGGSVSLNRPGISEGILERKLDNVDRSGARVLVTDNPGCIMHLRSGIRASSRNVAVRHIAEVIAERIRARRAAVS